MSALGGIPAGPVPVRTGPPPLPFPVAAARALVQLLFGLSLLGGLGLLGSGLAVDGPLAQLVGLVLYGAAPGVVGMLLARRVRTGGRRVRGGLIAVQLWMVAGAVGNIGGGSGRGFAQLVLPLLVLWFLTRAESREWFGRPGREAGELRRRAGWRFSLPRMIRWRRDRGQSTAEYAGLVVIIAGIVLALTLTGFGGRIVDGIRTAVCSITSGADCGGGAGGGGGDQAQGRPPAGGAGGAGGGAGGSGGADAWGAVGGTGGGGPGGGGAGGAGDTGGATGGGPGGAGGAGEDVAPVDGIGPEGGDDASGEGEEPEEQYDVPEADPDDPQQQPQEKPEEEEEEDCSGWGMFGCAADRVGQVFQGVVVDGVVGDVTGFFGLFSADTWSGIGDYGKQIAGDWAENAKKAPGKWASGDYFGAIGDWATATGKSAVGIADDLFVGDEVRERWNNGQKTRAVSNVVWNVGSLFIPGYDVAKVAGKFTHLGKAAKGVAEAAEAAGDAGAAAKRARKAAEAGDVEGARKAAKEADEAADKAEERARRTGCSIALPYGPGMAGVPGSGTGLIAAGPAPRIRYLADEGCDTTAKKEAEEARKQERDAYLAKKRAEEPARAAQAAKDAKKWPDPVHGDKKDPRNYEPGAFAKDLKTPTLGDADLGDGYWASRDRNPAPTFKNESWLRYQEQITGTTRGHEYVVPHPEKGKRAVEFDGWDSGRQVFLEAKNGYDSYLARPGKTKLTKSGADKFVAEAQGQLAAAKGKTVEWHFSNKEVAAAAQKLFDGKEMPIVVKVTKREPGGPKKPDAFD
ncbi:hypothetical protein GCM10010329_54720 [Streptomyces spiroverticillatus]|uniref:Tox-REase-5 domain-containing protein n=1 Tax=Streptomyces finlayi TaxID=67296 RepID=A0A918X386_9ACTN|nr:Tox-REase-5 domain-containing protein [Streptomyces finlayi]GHA24429.1 hypothetical protein GCM10010329_54720 [Streptomyces spiroverticillatus]GHD05875.1 hypothetical protein GCM10010334_57080 [Streptomyces finlayi]